LSLITVFGVFNEAGML